ncbi:MAG: hypothetical protein RIR01_1261 [Bacteroidota bacterium]|jgi:succinyl-CoA synthetase alpha subunit
MGYTEIYQEIYKALQTDGVDTTIIVGPAKRITDALWELKIITTLSNFQIPNTIELTKSIIHSRFQQGQ